MRFKFKAIKNSGERYDGTLESVSKFTLYNELKAQGEMLISAEEIGASGFTKYFSKVFSFIGNISMAQKIAFAKNLAAMIKAGLALSRALSVIERQSKEGRFKAVVSGINLEIGGGKWWAI
jgi:type II secretory pathway component PulF